MVEDKKPADDAGKNSRELEAEKVDRDDQGRFVVEEPKPEPEVEVEVPKPAPKAKAEEKPAPKAKAAAAKVEISKAALVYSERKRNSVSVGVLQDRLADLNYAGARADFRGWFHDGTKRAIEAWQKDNGLKVTGTCESDSDLKFLFDGTDVVVVD